jgi:hypothetical protein
MAKQVKNMENWITQKEFSIQTGANFSTVRDWVRRGNLVSKVFPEYNNQILVDRNSLKLRKKVK